MPVAAVREAVQAVAAVALAAGQAVRVEPGHSFCILKGELLFLWNRKQELIRKETKSMRLVFADGTELKVSQVVESILPRNTMEVRDGKVLEIGIPEDCSLSLEELAALFTKEACTTLQSVAGYGTVDYQGYTTLLSVSNIAAPTVFAKSVRLGQAQ